MIIRIGNRDRGPTGWACLCAVVMAALTLPPAGNAARLPTLKERKAITASLPAAIKNIPIGCVWLDIRVSSRNPRYAYVGMVYVGSVGAHSVCLRYASNGFAIVKNNGRWKQIYAGSVQPPCSFKIPRDLVSCH